MVVKGVKEGAVHEISRPDHSGRPHQEAASQTSKTISNAKCGDAKEELESPAKVLLVKELLGQDHIGGIKRASTIGSLVGKVNINEL